MLWELLLLLAVVVILFYKWSIATFKTFEERGIPYIKPYPLFGNGAGMLKKNYSVVKTFHELYKNNKQHKIFGYYNMRQPMFFIHDPAFIKKICIKDFEYFPNHNPVFQSDNDPLMSNMLMNLKDQTWKDMRNTLTPVFTAAKMRTMFSLMQECFDQSLKHLSSLSKNGEPFDLELKECFTRLSNDIIASTAFGLKINSYEQRDNEFFKVGQAITNFKGMTVFKMMLNTLVPKLTQLLGIKIFDGEKCDYFMRLVVNAMKYRKEHNIVRPDMIELLLEANNDSNNKWTDVELVAQCFIFFFAAFENNSNLITTTSIELMLNPDVQERLYEEVLEFNKNLSGAPLNYDIVNKMKYLDMVLSESLRKCSLSLVTDRVCAKDYKLYDDDDNFVFEFKKGDNIWLPLLGLSLDEQYFENPYVFDPERFSEENKHNIKPCTYLPFGVGQRNCIGNRYALMQVKAMLFYIVLNYKLERCEKSVTSILESASGYTVVPKDCGWIRFVPRN